MGVDWVFPFWKKTGPRALPSLEQGLWVSELKCLEGLRFLSLVTPMGGCGSICEPESMVGQET